MRSNVAIFVSIASLLSPTLSYADVPFLDALASRLKHEWLSVGVLLQVVADFQYESHLPAENGFSVANFRIQAKGTLDDGFSYFLQTNFASSPSLLDAYLSYEAHRSATIDAGAMKAPFSAEFLIPAQSIDFVNRSQVASSLAPGRQIGVNLRGAFGRSPLSYAIGVFNGNGVRANGNDGDGVLGVFRLGLDSSSGGGRTEIGFSAAFGRDDAARVGPIADFSGDRTLFGADTRIERGNFLGSSEVIWAALDPRDDESTEPWGYQVTAAAMVCEKAQLLARFDAFNPGDSDWSNYVVAGVNMWPTGAAQLQVNLLVPTHEAARYSQLLVNAQLWF